MNNDKVLIEYVKPVIVDSIAWNIGERQLVYPEKADLLVSEGSAVVVSSTPRINTIQYVELGSIIKEIELASSVEDGKKLVAIVYLATSTIRYQVRYDKRRGLEDVTINSLGKAVDEYNSL